MENKVTSISELKEYAKGQIVRLPDFAEGQPFYARLKRPSLMAMAKNGKIPNALLTKTNELFASDASGFDPDDKNMMKDIFEVIDSIAGEVFVEPTYKEMKDAEITLTDEQLMFVFTYTQNGVKALETFRTE